MKLATVEQGNGVVNKVKLFAASTVLRDRVPDVLRVLLYKPEFFGSLFARYTDQLMRRPSEWTVGERELFAAYVSKLNNCSFCTGIHCSMAIKVLGQDIVTAVLADWRTASVSPQLRAGLAFLEKLILHPTQLGGDDVRAARSAGITDAGLETVIHVGVNFSIINRVADALGFETPSTTTLARLGGILLSVGYKF